MNLINLAHLKEFLNPIFSGYSGSINIGSDLDIRIMRMRMSDSLIFWFDYEGRTLNKAKEDNFNFLAKYTGEPFIELLKSLMNDPNHKNPGSGITFLNSSNEQIFHLMNLLYEYNPKIFKQRETLL